MSMRSPGPWSGRPVTVLFALVTTVTMTLGVAPPGAVAAAASPSAAAACVPTVNPDWSAARVWDEAVLDAIRRDLPRPTVHARNLFHMSAAMWDTWAAYDPVAQGYFTTEKLHATDVEAARSEAISYAAYRILSERYAKATGAPDSLAEFDTTMASQCYDITVTTTVGDTPAALGNRIAAAAIAFGLADGSNEQNDYASTYVPVNKPLIVTEPGTKMSDPNHWQPLALDKQVAQNGVPIPGKVQKNVTPFWGHVTSFGLPASTTGVPIDPGTPPAIQDKRDKTTGMSDFQAAALAVIERSNQLSAANPTTVDISPGSVGNNDLGTNDGSGYSINPVTGAAYAPDTVNQGDFARALTEFWADGPKSETPPGHWNVIANTVGDSAGFVPRIGGTGPAVDRLEWDVKTYFALNGALHDAAVAAWGAKGFYDTARPISMIRYMAGKGQSSDKHQPSYDPEGLPLVPGLIELVTKQNSAHGKPLAALRKHVGEIAINTWQGNPADPTTQDGGVGWILAKDWVPYQKPTFVTPAFSGFISGHSTFSRAAAEVLTSMTGSAFFPGGLGEFVIPKGGLTVEAGPTTDVPLQWATYYDAADQAGVSRLYGGIHIPQDDFSGRITGSVCGKAAWALAEQYFDGTAPTKS